MPRLHKRVNLRVDINKACTGSWSEDALKILVHVVLKLRLDPCVCVYVCESHLLAFTVRA